MVLSDLSSGAQDTIVPEGSIATINDTAAIVSKIYVICLPANHCLSLQSTSRCCGFIIQNKL